MYKLIKAELILSALLSCVTFAQAQESGMAGQSRDRQARERAERDARAKEKKGEKKKEPGTRCARWKQGKA